MSDEEKPRRLTLLICLWAVIVAGVAIRGCGMTERTLWFDEAYSWRMSQFPLNEILGRVSNDVHPPLYYLVLKAWCAVFGDSVLAMRGLSVLLAAATLFAMYLYMERACREREADDRATQNTITRPATIALITVLLVAISVFQIRWAAEIRMYMLGTALAALSSWAIFRALQERNHPVRSWIVYAILSILLLYTHYYGLFVVAAQSVFLLGCWLVPRRAEIDEPKPLHLVLAGSMIAVGFGAWLPVLLRQRQLVRSDFWLGPMATTDVPFAIYRMFVQPENAIWSTLGVTLTTVLVAVILVFLLWHPRAVDWYILVTATIPIVCAVSISYFGTPVFHVRYFLFAHLFLLAGAARALCRIPPMVRSLVLAFVVINCLLIDGLFWEQMDFAGKQGAKGVALYLSHERTPNEPVIVCSGMWYFPILYHAVHRSNLHCFHQGSGIAHYHGAAIVAPGELISEDEIMKLKSQRVWVVDIEVAGRMAQTVPVPSAWRVYETAKFREPYGAGVTLVLRLYETGTASN